MTTESTKRSIFLNDKQFDYLLRVSRRARRMRISISGSKGLIVTIPYRASIPLMEKFLHEKSHWIIEKLTTLSLQGRERFPAVSRANFLKNKEQAKALVLERIEHFNALYQFPFRSVSIRNQKTRWGSCSKSGNLSFNYKILLLTPRMADYIVIHELCHLRELNHSQRFWRLVAQVLPDHKEIRRDLRASGPVLG